MLTLSFRMVNLSKEVREELRANRIKIGNEKRWKWQQRYLKQSLPVKEWTVKGVITRLYGQGAQKLFSSFTKYRHAAVAGSVGVAIYEAKLTKKDIDWVPEVVKVFVAVPFVSRKYPLRVAFPVMTEWLKEVREQGFDYRLDAGGMFFRDRCISFLFKCGNVVQHASMRVPSVLFVVRCADSVRQMCERLDLTVSSPILGVAPNGLGMEVEVTDQIREVFESRRCQCRYVELDEQVEACVKKYHKRGFKVMQSFRRSWYCVRSEELYPCGLSYKCADVPQLLGRKPTRHEREEFLVEE